MEIDEDILKQETTTEKKDELEMLKEFERRRKFKSAFDVADKIESLNDVHRHKRINPPEKPSAEEEKPRETLERRLLPDPDKGELYDPRHFNLIFLDSGMVCNITRLNRIYNRRVLIYMGNKDGLISYAIGKGPLYEDAWINAYKELRKNLTVINLDKNMSLPVNLFARFNDYRLFLKSTYNPSIWGDPKMCLMLRYAGIYHVEFSIISREKDPYAMIYCFFKCLTKNVTRQQWMEITNTRDYKEYIGRPRRYEFSLSDGINKI